MNKFSTLLFALVALFAQATVRHNQMPMFIKLRPY